MFIMNRSVGKVFKKGVKKDLKKSEEIPSQVSNKDKLNAAKQNNKEVRKKIKWKNRKVYFILVVLVLVVIGVAVLLDMYFDKLKYEPYLKYEEKMKVFGFDKMYNNQSAKTSDSVTKAEALKLAIAAIYNADDISGVADENTEYENATWTEYAEAIGITKEDINNKNFNDKVKYIDVISYFENCKTIFLNDKEIKNTDAKIKDISKYTTDQQIAVKDMIANEVIYLISNKLGGNEDIFKGQLNEIVVNFVEKYDTIAMRGDQLNINPEKIPANAEEYPYTLANVDKATYEKPFFPGYAKEALSPKELYSYKKESYPQIQMRCEEFFNALLNIDYKTITEESLRAKIEPYFIFTATDEAVRKYVQHVKDNQIVLEGSSKVQIPAIYYDGDSIRVRIRLTFNVKHSNTKDSLIYLDMLDGLKETYEKDSYDILVDYYMSSAIGNNNLYVDEKRLYGAILDKETCGITKEVDKTVMPMRSESVPEDKLSITGEGNNETN